MNIQGYTNQQAVEVLRHTGQTVHLKLVRRGFQPEEFPAAVTAPTPPPLVTVETKPLLMPLHHFSSSPFFFFFPPLFTTFS